VIVRWSLADLRPTLEELRLGRPFVIASERWRVLDLPHVAWWSEVPSARAEPPDEADCILAVGGGSAIDTGKYVSARSGRPVVHVPTTYSGAEWTTFYGIRTPDRRIQGGGAGAHPVAVVYDVDLTLDLPPDVTAGTALNALAHCAEALYVNGHTPEADEQALLGATLIARALPRVLTAPQDREARDDLLHGAAHAGRALGLAGLALAHAIAQALGGFYGIPHGAMNALALPPVLRFNADAAAGEIARFGEAIGGDAVELTRKLARLGGFERLRDFGVPEADLPSVAEAASRRGGNQANPRPATAGEILGILRTLY